MCKFPVQAICGDHFKNETNIWFRTLSAYAYLKFSRMKGGKSFTALD